jgi:hypothetical protein
MRYARFALLLALAVLCVERTGSAARRKRSAQRAESTVGCPAYKQERVGNEGLRLELRNGCAFPISCTLSWVVRCRSADAESPGSRSSALELQPGARERVLASGSACGAGGWDVSDINWSCDHPRSAPSRKDPSAPEEL